MFCTKCGAQIPDGNLFCTSCGAKVEDQNAGIKNIPTPQQSEPAQIDNAQTPVSEVPQQPEVAEQADNTPAPDSQAQAFNPIDVQPTAPAAPISQPAPTQPTGFMPNAVQNSMPVPNTPNTYFNQNTQPAPAVAANTPANNKKNLIIIGSIALAAVILIVVVCILIFSNHSNPADDIVAAINDGNYSSAREIYRNSGDSIDDYTAIREAEQKQIDAVIEKLNSGEYDVEKAQKELDKIAKLPKVKDSAIEEARNLVYKLESSENSFNRAEAYLKDGDYYDAIYNYENVIEEDANYKKAQEGKTKAIDGLRNNVLEDAKSRVESYGYSSALSYLQNQYDSSDYLKGDKKILEQINTYADEAIKKADADYAEGNYEDAINSLTYCIESLSDGDAKTKIQQKIDEITKNMPTALSSFDVTNGDRLYGGSYYDMTDVLGNEYTSNNKKYASLYVSKYYSNETASGEFYLGKQYAQLQGTIAVRNNSDNIKSKVQILDGTKVLYTSPNLTNKSKPIDIVVDVTNVEWLTIKVQYVAKSGNGSMDVILNDFNFYKEGSTGLKTPEEASKPESSAPEASKPESSAPEASKPASSAPEASKPASSAPEASKSETSKPESSEAVKPESKPND